MVSYLLLEVNHQGTRLFPTLGLRWVIDGSEVSLT